MSRRTRDPGWLSLGMPPPGSLQSMPNAPQGVRSGRFRPFGLGDDCATLVFDEHRYARLGGGQSYVLSATDSTLVLPESDTLRNFLGFRNTSAAANVFIDFGNAATAASAWLRLEPNQIVLLDTVVPQDTVFAIADAAPASLVVIFSTYPGRRC